MNPGRLARTILGERWFPVIGAYYRSLFVDLEKVADSFPPLPARARILDVGGGDGSLLNVVLRRYPAAEATIIDLGTRLGGSLDPDRASRVRLLPGVTLRDYARLDHPWPDLIVVSDVLHHVPPAERRSFFADLRALIGGRKITLFVKDLEPGSLRATAGYLADRHISGDKNVELVPEETVRSLLIETFPKATLRSTDLSKHDRPNYSVVCELP